MVSGDTYSHGLKTAFFVERGISVSGRHLGLLRGEGYVCAASQRPFHPRCLAAGFLCERHSFNFGTALGPQQLGAGVHHGTEIFASISQCRSEEEEEEFEPLLP